MSHPAHSHTHLHPHWSVRGHHHPHGLPHFRDGSERHKRPSKLAHHHPIPRSQRPSVSSTSTRNVRRVWRAVYRWFPHAVNVGIFNCRKISNSTKWSEHAFADAWDIGSPVSVKTLQPDPYLDAIVEYLDLNRVRLAITRIIYKVKDHFSHTHVDVNPDHFTDPPCAGG